jgi:hypothetical protein
MVPTTEPERSTDLGTASPASRPDLAGEIANRLGETNPAAQAQIRGVVQTLGAEGAQTLLTRTLAVEAGDGLMVLDGSRRRTPGGTFLKLSKGAMSPEQRLAVFGPPPVRVKTPRPARTSEPRPAKRHKAPKAAPKPPSDEMIAAGISQLEYGEAKTVKITLIGKPARVVTQNACVILGLRSARMPSLPKGLPSPSGSTDYAVFVAAKQWGPVAVALERDSDDVVVLEGYPCLDKRFARGIVVYVTKASTVGLQRSQREAQQQSRTAGAQQ